LFEAAGWSLAEGATYRANAAGEEMALKFTTTTAQFRQTWAAIFEEQMKTCGLRIVRFHVPAAWWFGDNTGLARRDFELGAFAWVMQSDPGGRTLYACDQIPSLENGWKGQNYMGWCNPRADEAIRTATASVDPNGAGSHRAEEFKIPTAAVQRAGWQPTSGKIRPVRRPWPRGRGAVDDLGKDTSSRARSQPAFRAEVHYHRR
jgi:hypothetical protein